MKLLLLPALLSVWPLSAPARPFTNQKGQVFEATVVSVDSTSAELMGGDGRKYKVALSTLSEADQQFCKAWLVANPPLKLTVKTEGFAAKGTRQTKNDASRNGGDSVVSRSRRLEEGYRITVSNWSRDPGAKVSGLTVEYAIVVGFYDSAAKDKRGVKEVVKGSASLPELTGTKAHTLETKTVATGQSAAVASSTTTDANGDSQTSSTAAVYRESMDGICVVIKHGGRIVATHTTGRIPKELPVEMTK